ncbi:EFHC1-like protein [Mya arenaria]|uniref:EFHC1-like protein n=1 Tax=Mya arenaria TaxID=6604 RepID=A0ABY7F9R5_MYAAR|nr:EFHC1-like protein [Mya arenaria]
MEGLPFLPGNSFTDPTRSKYHRSHSLNYRNGYALPTHPTVGIGGEPIVHNQLSEQELDELANFNPTLTYGQAKQAPPEDFVPSHVAWDKKVLRYNAYFKQTIHESKDEYFRVRPVDIFYYLEDDSIAVIEPHVENSGMPQGKLIKRQRLPKNDQGDHWHWKDLNNGVNVTFYGKVFHIVNMDQFTSNFLESEGLIVNPSGQLPTDPYIERRKNAAALRTFTTPSSFDKQKQFLELDRKVLRFFCAWDDRDNMFGEMRAFIIHYFLVDDTLEVREVHTANDDTSFPGVVMELSSHEIKEYFTPKDFSVGETVMIYGRRFIVYDCDNFTKSFYYQTFGVTDFPTVDVSQKLKDLPKMEIPPFNQFGSMEDSLQSCLSLIPQPPKKDFIKMLENDHKVLRFEATMDSVRPEDKGRRFILSYRLADDMMTIYEPPVRNSGIIGGKFLERTRVAKPNCPPDQPMFYGPQDFYIGAVIEVFRHRFVITNADEYSLQQRLAEGSVMRETVKGAPMKQVRAQLKKIAITDKTRVDEMFLRYNTDRTGFIDALNMRDLCRRLQLPADDDLVNALVAQCTENQEGKISLEDFRRFVESS